MLGRGSRKHIGAAAIGHDRFQLISSLGIWGSRAFHKSGRNGSRQEAVAHATATATATDLAHDGLWRCAAHGDDGYAAHGYDAVRYGYGWWYDGSDAEHAAERAAEHAAEHAAEPWRRAAC